MHPIFKLAAVAPLALISCVSFGPGEGGGYPYNTTPLVWMNSEYAFPYPGKVIFDDPKTWRGGMLAYGRVVNNECHLGIPPVGPAGISVKLVKGLIALEIENCNQILSHRVSGKPLFDPNLHTDAMVSATPIGTIVNQDYRDLALAQQPHTWQFPRTPWDADIRKWNCTAFECGASHFAAVDGPRVTPPDRLIPIPQVAAR